MCETEKQPEEVDELPSIRINSEFKGQKIHPWEQSTTGAYTRQELQRLRTDKPEDLAEFLQNKHPLIANSAIRELIDHGNPRKATELTQKLVGLNPSLEGSIRKYFVKSAESLLYSPPGMHPSCPSEYPRDEIINYIQ